MRTKLADANKENSALRLQLADHKDAAAQGELSQYVIDSLQAKVKELESKQLPESAVSQSKTQRQPSENSEPKTERNLSATGDELENALIKSSVGKMAKAEEDLRASGA